METKKERKKFCAQKMETKKRKFFFVFNQFCDFSKENKRKKN